MIERYIVLKVSIPTITPLESMIERYIVLKVSIPNHYTTREYDWTVYCTQGEHT